MSQTAGREPRPLLRSQLAATLEGWGTRRVLLVTTPKRRHLPLLQGDLEQLDGLQLQVFDGARVHVPQSTVDAALGEFDANHSDVLLSLGGGAATGLAKALRLERQARFVAIPTTYAGSEWTSIHGVTDGALKRTGRDPRARPDAVVCDAELLQSLPSTVAVSSLANALAHPVSALTTGELEQGPRGVALAAAGAVFASLQAASLAPMGDDETHAAMDAAREAANVLERSPLGLHHRRAHSLGGHFDLPHSELHAVLLIQTLAALVDENAPLHAALSASMGCDSPATALSAALSRVRATTSLAGLGVERAAYDAWQQENAELTGARSEQLWTGEPGAVT